MNIINSFSNKLYLIFFSLLILIMSSCETKEGEPAYLGTEYFGLLPEKWVVYDIDSTVYDDFLGEVFHYQYQVKEVNAEVYTDSQGNENMRLERFWRTDENDSWKIKNVWSAGLQSQRATKTEENVTYIKLTFPAESGRNWDGNAFNNKPAQQYVISDIHAPKEIGDILFDSTLTVLQKDLITLIGEDLQYEIYVPGIGMVERKYVMITREVDGTIIRGVDYSYTIAEYGKDEPD
ncbi:MAG: hypothetical protein ABR597_12135 [Bacteroidales bacterium]